MNQSNQIQLESISLTKNKTHILKNISLTFERGELICLLGPSGCGKTSLLRVLSGLETEASGTINVFGQNFLSPSHFLPPQKRNIGMVFQDYSLFPHLNVLENVLLATEINSAKLSKQDRIAEALKWLSLVEIEPLKEAKPQTLSGGQMQRVAIARALAQGASLLLLDEPFSGLDTELRHKLALEIRILLKKVNLSALLVTHDQNEAFSFADKIAVINQGSLEQFCLSYDLYHHPLSKFVAQFIGEGKLVQSDLLKPLLPQNKFQNNKTLLLRPDDIIHDDLSPIKAKIISKNFRGSHFMYELEFETGLRSLCLVPSHHNHQIGESIGVVIEMDHIIEL
jgi:iron(III) transport system ATP-binding protein